MTASGRLKVDVTSASRHGKYVDIPVDDLQSFRRENRREIVKGLPEALPNLPDHTDVDVHTGCGQQPDRRGQLGVTFVRTHDPKGE